ncbi:uncharacterized protein N7482_003905 [Penicillium canariense]|uniref:BZIP domain-containing protein n=1 Tax=Penicillium canariense TaxID=189055 RepID=A0A9W9LPL6_9EURO|nr:uncharacterized protein N7482_003905 [Penicillium canariense]KAJ5168311.1 hypothetical protein N7482_003905 [Penicillium canariense]
MPGTYRKSQREVIGQLGRQRGMGDLGGSQGTSGVPSYEADGELSTRPFESSLLQNGSLLSSPSRTLSSFSTENDTITPHGTPSYFSPQHPSSESPIPGSLNFSIASRSSSSPHITISPIDISSFTTDQFQQPWLPTPPPTQPLASSSINSNNSNNNNSAQEDFVLYPAPPAPRPQPRSRDSRALVPSSTALKPSALQPFLAQNHPRRQSFSLQLQRHLQQQFSGSPVPDPRVTKLARSPSYWSHPNSTTHSPRPHAASVPSLSPHNRPPVPQFPSTHKSQNIQASRRNMSTPNFQDHDAELFGLPSAGLTAGMGSPLGLGQLPLDSDADIFSPVAPQGTVSPKDLIPAESAGGVAPLFHDASATNVFDNFDLAAALGEPEKQDIAQAAVSMTPKRMAAAKSISSPISATGTTRHSSVSGISRQRKELSPIAFDPSDPIAAKRARNTEAARKSRAKKLERQTNAETRIADLQRQLAERDELIAHLQAQLEAHKQFA